MCAPALHSVPLRARDDGLRLRICCSQCDSSPAEVQRKLSEDLTKARFPGLTLQLLPQANGRLEHMGSHSYVVYDDGTRSQAQGPSETIMKVRGTTWQRVLLIVVTRAALSPMDALSYECLHASASQPAETVQSLGFMAPRHVF